MPKWVRAAPAILAGALVALALTTVTSAVPARAATPARADASGADLQVTPASIAFTVDPGATAKQWFVVANRSTTLRVTVRLAGVDATEKSGAVQYATETAAGGPGSWLTLSDVVTTLEPGTNVRVSLAVTPPGNAAPGHVTAGLVARVDRAARASDNEEVKAPAEVSLPVAIDVKGAPTALVSIASVKAVEKDGNAALDIRFQNSGATAATMAGQVRVAGASPHTDPVRVTIPPLTHTDVQVPFVMPAGGKAVKVLVSTKDARGNEATWGGEIGATPTQPVAAAPRSPNSAGRQTAPAQTGGSSLPLPLLVGGAALFLGAAVWFALEMRRSRAGRRIKVPAVPLAVPLVPVAPVAPVVSAPVAVAATHDAPTGAVAVQLAALVAAIDRLVARLGDVVVPVAGAPTRAPVSPSPPSSPREERVPANPAPQFYAPAANRGPGDAFDPYDWPTQEQLDQFAARRRAPQSDL